MCNQNRFQRKSVERKAQAENLESRRLMAIVWGNEASPANAFDSTFGSNSTIARAIANRAIADWNSVITNFNYGAGGPTNYNLDISIGTLGAGERGATSNVVLTAGGVPRDADITLDDNGGGAGWYLDPMPTDDGEFNTSIYAFEGTMSGTNFDFYRTIAHEIGHAVGLGLGSGWAIMNWVSGDRGLDQITPSATVGGVTVPVNLRLFSRNGVSATFTELGGGHIYEGANDPSFPTDPTFDNELLNPGRSVTTQTRQLISDIDARILQQAYGYTVVLPSQLNSMYSSLTSSNNKVTLTATNNSNTIVIDNTSSGRVRTSVSVLGVTYVESFPASSVSQVNVIARDGNDTISVSSTFSDKTYLDGGADNDQITAGPLNDTLIGGNGTDTLYASGNNDGDDNFYASNDQTSSTNSFVDTLDFTSKSANVNADFSGVFQGAKPAGTRNVTETDGGSSDIVMGFRVMRFGSGNDTITSIINAGPASPSYHLYGWSGSTSIYGGNGNDSINVYQCSAADLFDGGSGTDTCTGSEANDVLVSIEVT